MNVTEDNSAPFYTRFKDDTNSRARAHHLHNTKDENTYHLKLIYIFKNRSGKLKYKYKVILLKKS